MHEILKIPLTPIKNKGGALHIILRRPKTINFTEPSSTICGDLALNYYERTPD